MRHDLYLQVAISLYTFLGSCLCLDKACREDDAKRNHTRNMLGTVPSAPYYPWGTGCRFLQLRKPLACHIQDLCNNFQQICFFLSLLKFSPIPSGTTHGPPQPQSQGTSWLELFIIFELPL